MKVQILTLLLQNWPYMVIGAPLQLVNKPFAIWCFGHTMSKVCQYATNDAKFGVGMKKMSLKDSQVALQKTNIYTKKFSKNKQKWEKTYIMVRLSFEN